MNPNGTLLPLLDRIQGRALLVGGAGVVLGVVGALTHRGDANDFDRAYLFSYIFFLGLSLGSLALLMLHRQLGGAWGFLVRRPLESAAMTLPLMAVLFVPILVDLDKIYPWVKHHAETEVPVGGNPQSPLAVKAQDEPTARSQAGADAAPSTGPVKVTGGGAGDASGTRGGRRDPLEADNAYLLTFKSHWLDPTWFTIRVAIYFVIWITLAATLNIGSRRQDETGSTKLAYFLQSLSAPGLVLYFLTVSLALVDWGMSLEPEWYSSIYGVLLIIGQAVSAMALMIGVAAVISRRGETEGLDRPETFNDLGNLLLAFVMFWAYLSFSQFLIIWAGNLSEEIPWYARRLRGTWTYVGQFLILFHFAVPFLILLSRPAKRNISRLSWVAALVLIAHLVDVYWLIAPSFGEGRPPLRLSWLDLTVPVGMGGLWVWTFLWFLKSKPLMVAHDPELLPALKQAGGH